MIRSLFLSLAVVFALCCSANADFIIDDFNGVDADPVNMNGPFDMGSGIFVDVTSSGGTAFSLDGFGYGVTGATGGDSFSVAYTWASNFGGNISSVLGNEIVSIPTAFSVLGWNTTVDTGAGAVAYNSGDVIAMDAATQLTFSFTSLGGPLGATGSFGGAALVATPEPTALMMLGSVAGFGLIRRRRR
jgi:hypothetical protein